MVGELGKRGEGETKQKKQNRPSEKLWQGRASGVLTGEIIENRIISGTKNVLLPGLIIIVGKEVAKDPKLLGKRNPTKAK